VADGKRSRKRATRPAAYISPEASPAETRKRTLPKLAADGFEAEREICADLFAPLKIYREARKQFPFSGFEKAGFSRLAGRQNGLPRADREVSRRPSGPPHFGRRNDLIGTGNLLGGFGFIEFKIAGRRAAVFETETGFGPEDGSSRVFAGGGHIEERGGDFEIGLNGLVEFFAAMLAKSFGIDAKDNGNLGLRDAETAHARDLGAVFVRGVKRRTADEFEDARFGDALNRKVHMRAG